MIDQIIASMRKQQEEQTMEPLALLKDHPIMAAWSNELKNKVAELDKKRAQLDQEYEDAKTKTFEKHYQYLFEKNLITKNELKKMPGLSLSNGVIAIERDDKTKEKMKLRQV